jgi:hypothetical protein
MNVLLASKDLTQTLDQYPWYVQLSVGIALTVMGSTMIYIDKRTGEDSGFLWFAGMLLSVVGILELFGFIA